MGPARSFAARRKRREMQAGPCDKIETKGEDVHFLELSDLPMAWHYDVEPKEFRLDIEERRAASEPSEKRVTKEGAAKFAEAKRLELQSFFDVQARGRDLPGVADPSKVARAGFLLKWSRNPGGSYRAEARLVVQ